MIDTQTLVRTLQKELPNMIQREEDARAAIRAVFAAVATGLGQLEPARLEGLGELTVRKDDTPPRIEFTPTAELEEALAAAAQKETLR